MYLIGGSRLCPSYCPLCIPIEQIHGPVKGIRTELLGAKCPLIWMSAGIQPPVIERTYPKNLDPASAYIPVDIAFWRTVSRRYRLLSYTVLHNSDIVERIAFLWLQGSSIRVKRNRGPWKIIQIAVRVEPLSGNILVIQVPVVVILHERSAFAPLTSGRLWVIYIDISSALVAALGECDVKHRIRLADIPVDFNRWNLLWILWTVLRTVL